MGISLFFFSFRFFDFASTTLKGYRVGWMGWGGGRSKKEIWVILKQILCTSTSFLQKWFFLTVGSKMADTLKGLYFAGIKFCGFRGFWVKSGKSANIIPAKNKKVEIKSPWNLVPSVTIRYFKKYHVKLTYNKYSNSGEWGNTTFKAINAKFRQSRFKENNFKIPTKYLNFAEKTIREI